MSTKAVVQRYTLEDLFPDCMLPQCEQFKAGVVHQHILPHQREILDCPSKYLYCQGGVGSAKTIAFAAKAVHLSLSIPMNRGIVGRFEWAALYDSAWRDIKACIMRLVDKDLIPEPAFSRKVQGDYTHILFHNGSEIQATQTKNLTKGLGASHGWFWIDDAMETPEEFFIGNSTNAGLLSRLRLPEVHFRQPFYDETTRPHGALHGMVSSNPPPINHWLHALFGDKPGTRTIGEDSITWMQVASLDNPFTGADYSKGLIAIQRQMKRGESNVQRIIHGKSVPAYPGIPVYPQFNHSKHVAPLKLRPDLPVIVSYDFGERHPAVVCSNLYTCKYGTHHYFTLSEITDCFHSTIYNFQDRYVKPHLDALYKDCLLLYCGDRSGYRASSSNKDRRSDMLILMIEYELPFVHCYTTLAPSLQYMRGMLEPKKPCNCGLPHILISSKCKGLIGALEGGYYFGKSKSGFVADKPTEDMFFADIACAWRYGAENYTKLGLSWEDRKALRQANQAAHIKSSHLQESSTAFLERIDRELSAVFSR